MLDPHGIDPQVDVTTVTDVMKKWITELRHSNLESTISSTLTEP